MSTVQSVSFDRKLFTPRAAGKWLREHKLRPSKPADLSNKTLRYRIQDPDLFDQFATKKTKKGVTLTLGIGKKKEPVIPPAPPPSPVKKKINRWIQHVKQYRAEHPDESYKVALREAKKTYTKL